MDGFNPNTDCYVIRAAGIGTGHWQYRIFDGPGSRHPILRLCHIGDHPVQVLPVAERFKDDCLMCSSAPEHGTTTFLVMPTAERSPRLLGVAQTRQNSTNRLPALHPHAASTTVERRRILRWLLTRPALKPRLPEGTAKYTISVSNNTVGFAEFADRGNQRVFYHTVIDPEFGGRGLATILVEAALDGAHRDGTRIVPVCSMVATVVDKHPEYQKITDPVTTEVIEWAQTQPFS